MKTVTRLVGQYPDDSLGVNIEYFLYLYST